MRNVPFHTVFTLSFLLLSF
jgi:hypothetical protein